MVKETTTLAKRVADKLRDWLAGHLVLKLIGWGGGISSFLVGFVAHTVADNFRRGVLYGIAGAVLTATLFYLGAWTWMYLPRKWLEAEVQDLVTAARWICRETDFERSGELLRALARMRDVVAESARYKERVKLGQLVHEINQAVIQSTSWDEVRSKVTALRVWAENTESDILLIDPSPKDAFLPRQ